MSALPRCPVLGRVTLDPCPACRCPRSLAWPVAPADEEPWLDQGELIALRQLLPLLHEAAEREGAERVIKLLDLHAAAWPAPAVPAPAGPLACGDPEQT